MSRTIFAFLAMVLVVGVSFGQNLNLNGANTLGGTWKVKGNINNTSSTGTNDFTGTVELKGTAAQSIGGHASNVVNFATISTTGISTKTFTTSSAVSTSINTGSAGATQYILSASKTLTVSGTIANGGGATAPYDFTASGATVDYAGGVQTVFSGVTYDNLTVSTASSKSLNGDVTVATALNVSAGDLSIGANTLTIDGTLATTGTLTGGATSNLDLGGTGSISLDVVGGLNNFTLDRNTFTVTLGNSLNLEGALALNNGTLEVSTNTLTLKGAVSAAGSGAITSAATGTVDYNTGTQNVLASNYGNLSFTAGDKTLPTSGTVGIAGTFTPGGGSHTVTSSTVDFNGGAQSVPSFTFNNLIASGAASTKTAGGAITVGGTFDNGGLSEDAVTFDFSTFAHTLPAYGSLENTNSIVQFSGANNGVVFGSGTVEYNLAGAQTIRGHATNFYATLTLSGSGSKTVADADADVTTESGLTVNSGVDLAVEGTRTLLVGNTSGDLTIASGATVTNAGTIEIGN